MPSKQMIISLHVLFDAFANILIQNGNLDKHNTCYIEPVLQIREPNILFVRSTKKNQKRIMVRERS